MKKQVGAVVHFTNGESKTFAKGTIKDFAVMDKGMFFFQGVSIEKEEKNGRLVVTNTRTWVPFSLIKSVELTQDTAFDPGDEVKKYKKFKMHGIDMSTEKVSDTVIDPLQVGKMIDNELKAEKEGGK